LNKKINIELGSLIKLKDIKSSNSSTRALSYMLYENNGVLKRDNIEKLLRNIDQKERKILRDQGVKFGRYHIFLYKLFKPNVVSLRLILWKNYNEKYYDLEPPTFGLNFLNDKKFSLNVISTVKTNANTGVEMEALTAVTISCLTIYDMCKYLNKKIKIQNIHLVSKRGGKSNI